MGRIDRFHMNSKTIVICVSYLRTSCRVCKNQIWRVPHCLWFREDSWAYIACLWIQRVETSVFTSAGPDCWLYVAVCFTSYRLGGLIILSKPHLSASMMMACWLEDCWVTAAGHPGEGTCGGSCPGVHRPCWPGVRLT